MVSLVTLFTLLASTLALSPGETVRADSVSVNVTSGTGPVSMAVDPVTRSYHVANINNDEVNVIRPDQFQSSPFTTAITPLPGDAITTAVTSVNFNATDAIAPTAPKVQQSFYHMGTQTGPWLRTTHGGFGSHVVTPSLLPGISSRFALANDETDGQEATYINTGQRISANPGEVGRDHFRVVQLPVLAFDCTTVTEIPNVECEALVALYHSTDGPNWTNNAGWLMTGFICGWHGITCTNGQLTTIDLGDNQLTGGIPSELGDLTSLSFLDLGNNQLTGSIPTELGNLASLERLHLDDNKLIGNVPPELGNLASLERLNLGDNKLIGSVPPELGNLASLLSLQLDDNQLTGSIPLELVDLASLLFLDIRTNQLTGNIPPELGNLASLRDLRLQENQLTGSIPPELSMLVNLESLRFQENQLSGSIPPELGKLASLQDLRLQENQLTGSIPPELGNLANLDDLSLESNQLTGSIPPELGNLSSLSTMTLNGNELTGSIPPELGNLANLTRLSLQSNQLSGSVPPELGSLANLTNLRLQNNQLSGGIPPELGNLASLESLEFRNNDLSGGIPLSFTSLNLVLFRFEDTRLCEPLDQAFQDWLTTIASLTSTGFICPPPGAADLSVHKTTAVEIEAGDGPDKVNVNPNTNMIYVNNRDSGNVTVIDGATNTFITNISVGSDPDDVVIDQTTNRIYVNNRNSDSVSVIDGSTNALITNVPLGDFPDDVQVNPDTNRIYVNNRDGNSLSVIDATTNTVIATVPVGDRPNDFQLNRATNKIYVVNEDSNDVTVIDGATNAVITTISVGTGPRNPQVNPDTDRIYVRSSTDNTISVIDGTSDTVIATVPVGNDPDDVRVNSTTNRVYVANQEDNQVSVIDGATNAVISTINVGLNPDRMFLNSVTNMVYTLNRGDATVSVIDGATNSVVTTILVGREPSDFRINNLADRLYVSSLADNNVSVIDGATNTVVATIPVGLGPADLGINAATDTVYVSNSGSRTVSAILDPVAAGGTLSYTTTVTNNGPLEAQNVVVTDVLSGGITLDSTNGCSEDPTGVPTCSLGNIPAGGSVQYTADVTIDSGSSGTITNQAVVSSDTEDRIVANNTSVVSTSITPLANAVAQASFLLHQDVTDGATGFKVNITQITEPATGSAANVLLGSFQARLTYDGTCISVLAVRGMDFSINDATIDNIAGIATFDGSNAIGVPWPADMGHALTRLSGSVDQECRVDLELISLSDADGNAIAVPTVVSQTVRRGDARTDGIITIEDARYIVQYLSGLRPACTTEVNFNCLNSVNGASVRQDGEFDKHTVADAMFIAQYLVGIRDDFYKPVP